MTDNELEELSEIFRKRNEGKIVLTPERVAEIEALGQAHYNSLSDKEKDGYIAFKLLQGLNNNP